MATLEDKILGEKLHNYCSSSESENDDDDFTLERDSTNVAGVQELPSEVNKWEGTSQNTGPKGVIEDWRRYKQLQTEKRAEQKEECIALAKKLTMTVQSALDEEREKAALEDPELFELLDDEFLLEYQKKRMQEMLHATERSSKKFGNLVYLRSGEEYLDAIDKEDKMVTVIIHIYEDYIAACRVMNKCLEELAKIYSNTKFCAIVGSCASLSTNFKNKGLPALLVYKNGTLISYFVRISDDLGYEFYTEDLKDYLVEHGLLEDKSCLPSLIKDSYLIDDDSS